nr:hypothetical protein [Halocatena pleomorpha]
MELEVDGRIPCRLPLFAFQQTSGLQLTTVLVGSRVWEIEIDLQLRDSEFTLLGRVSEEIELSIVRKLLKNGL